MEEFADRPVAGNGIDNFSVAYLQRRDSTEEPLHPHSLVVRLLSQTGIIGTALFAGFLACALAAGIRGLRRGDRFARGLAAASLGAFAYWFGHASGDWLWAFPGLSAPAFAWLALAGAVEEQAAPVAGEAGERERVGADYDPDPGSCRGRSPRSPSRSPSSSSAPRSPTSVRSPPPRTSPRRPRYGARTRRWRSSDSIAPRTGTRSATSRTCTRGRSPSGAATSTGCGPRSSRRSTATRTTGTACSSSARSRRSRATGRRRSTCSATPPS